MVVPAAPTAGEVIDPAWGALVHQAVVLNDIQSAYTGQMGDAGSGPISSQLAVAFPRAFAAVPYAVPNQSCVNFNWFAGFNGNPPTASGFTIASDRPGANSGDAAGAYYLAYGPRAGTIPDVPTLGEPIQEAWGDLVHDAVVAMDLQVGRAVPGDAGSGPVSAQLRVNFARPFAAVPQVLMTTDNHNWWPGLNGAHPDVNGFTFAVNRYGAVGGDATGISWLAYGPRLTVPAPPTAGEPIAEPWGDIVHDMVVANEIQVGNASVVSGSSVSSVVNVTFPHAFAEAPYVFFQSNNFNGHAQFNGSPATASGFAFAFRRPDAGATGAQNVPWFAYGKRA